MANFLTNIKSKRRWVQFSLRTGFLIVTAFCLTLGLWVVPAERQRRAVAAIEGLGGTVWYQQATKSNAFATAYLRRWLPPIYFDKIELVDFDATWITDAGLAHLQGLTSLQELDLNHTQVTDAGLAHLQKLTSLQWLYLRNTQVTDAGLGHLQKLTSLQELELYETRVTDAGVAKLRQALPTCKIWGP